MYSLYAFICTSPVLVRQDCWGIMCHSGFLYQITCRSHDDDIIVYMTLQCYVNEGRLIVYCFTIHAGWEFVSLISVCVCVCTCICLSVQLCLSDCLSVRMCLLAYVECLWVECLWVVHWVLI